MKDKSRSTAGKPVQGQTTTQLVLTKLNWDLHRLLVHGHSLLQLARPVVVPPTHQEAGLLPALLLLGHVVKAEPFRSRT